MIDDVIRGNHCLFIATKAYLTTLESDLGETEVRTVHEFSLALLSIVDKYAANYSRRYNDQFHRN